MLIKVLGLNIEEEIGGHLFIRSGTNHVATKDIKQINHLNLGKVVKKSKYFFFSFFGQDWTHIIF